MSPLALDISNQIAELENLRAAHRPSNAVDVELGRAVAALMAALCEAVPDQSDPRQVALARAEREGDTEEVERLLRQVQIAAMAAIEEARK